MQRTCETCGATFKARPYQVRAGMGKYCKRSCYIQIGALGASWAGGRRMINGYVQIWVGGPKRYEYEHVLIMENHLERKLISPECVHHENEDKSDNRLENLVLCADNKEHMRIHAGWTKVDNVWHKPCTKCKILKPVDSAYHRRANTIKPICKQCRASKHASL